MVKVLALRERFEHISKLSGYDALFGHLPPGMAVDSIFGNFKKMYPRGAGRLLQTVSKFANGSSFYNAQSVEAEAKVYWNLLRHKYDLVHYTHSEPYWGFGSTLKKFTKAKFVATNHQPVSWWKDNTKLFEKFKAFDAVICLTEYDRDYFNANLPGKAACIPHGVDIDFYLPGDVKRDPEKPFTIIFAGRYLRDTATLAKAVELLSVSTMNIRFDIVYSDKSQLNGTPMDDIKDLTTVTWHTGIPEAKLLELYQNADCCLVPLLDCTANNAILEAMACGVPIVSTDLPSVKTYLDNTMSILGREGNPGDLYEAVEKLYIDPQLRSGMAVNARRRAEKKFDWNVVAKQTIALFSSLL